jgi:hypothetical protein
MENANKTDGSERRYEPRHISSGETVIWKRMQAHLGVGRLHDISRSGASFFSKVKPWTLPEIGEIIGLRHGAAAIAEYYEVMRLEESARRTLIACHKSLPNVPAERTLPMPRGSVQITPVGRLPKIPVALAA